MEGQKEKNSLLTQIMMLEIVLVFVNPLMPGGNKKVTHT